MRSFLLALAVSSIPFAGFAAPLTGDTVTLTLDQSPLVPNLVPFGTFEAGSGIDLTLGVFEFDVDAGAGGDGFVWTSGANGFVSAGSAVSLTLSGLDFSGGEVLTGFDLGVSTLTDLSVSTTASSVTFSWTNDSRVGPDTVLSGTYETSAVIPIPASLPLLLGGLAGLGLVARRGRAG